MPTIQAEADDRTMKQTRTTWRRIILALLCLALIVWSVRPDLKHLPRYLSVAQEHAQTVAEHGHSHGLEEDLLWAMHGHAHDRADHEHVADLLLPPAPSPAPPAHGMSREMRPERKSPVPVFLLERPPRA